MLGSFIGRHFEIEIIKLQKVTVGNKPFSRFCFQFFRDTENFLSGHCAVTVRKGIGFRASYIVLNGCFKIVLNAWTVMEIPPFIRPFFCWYRTNLQT